MKLKNLFYAAIGMVALSCAVNSCKSEEDFYAPSAAVSAETLYFDAAGGTQTFVVSATRDWTLSTDADWIGLSTLKGSANEDVTITVTTAANDSYNQTDVIEVVVGGGLVTKEVTVIQEGPLGEYTTPTITIAEFLQTDGQTTYRVEGKIGNINTSYNYFYVTDSTGTVEVYKPTNWDDFADLIVTGYTAVVEGVYTKYTNSSGKSYDEIVGQIISITPTEQGDVEKVTVEEFLKTDGSTIYEVEGTISDINTTYKYFWLTDETGKVEVYQPTNWDDFADQIVAGYTAVVQGTYTQYTNKSGKTFDEIVGKIISITPGKGGQTGSHTDDGTTGTQTDPYTVNQVLYLMENSLNDESANVYVKGKVSEIKEISTSYGNASYYISDDGTTTDQYYIFRGYYLGNVKFTSEDQIKVGDEVVIYGKLITYNSTYEMAQGNYIYSLNGETSGTTPSTGSHSDDGTKGTVDSPYSVNQVLYLMENNKNDESAQVYVKGKISQIKEVSTSYGNASYYISDDGSTTDQYYIFRGYYLGNVKFTSEDQIKVGDEVIIYGKLITYNSTYEMAQGNYIYSLNGSTSGSSTGGSETGGETGGESGTTTNVTWSSSSDWDTSGTTVITYTSGSYTITCDKGGGKTNPTVASANDCRVYANGTVTIKSTSGNISKVVFNISKKGLYRLAAITADSGTVASQSSGDKTVTWTGSASSVTFTVGATADYGSDGSSKAGQLCFDSVDVTAE